ncbi:hypothetical protein [Rhodococcus sp. RDE2]|uniref:hypothetical protein n=1 Tax=Rhodococcus sp. RDE2 TaxID=2885078 RepID=UPI001E377542|nr:hypothetical protein [Rhodococcus sp. RDE2]BDB63513.1 hypothetical protein RDE2_53070 [Rhodococcus sp. RDE2]
MRFTTDHPADLQPGDVITSLIVGSERRRKQDWIVKAGWGPHPETGNPCIQMHKLPGSPTYDLNLWETDIRGVKFEVDRT